MPVVISARTSTDAGNRASVAASDGGLFVAPTPGGYSYPYTIDNSAGVTGQTGFYTRPNTAGPSSPATHTAGYPWLMPIMFAKSCVLTSAYIQVSAVPSGGNFTPNLAFYNADAVTGVASTKIVDAFGYVSLTTAGVISLAPSAALPNTVFTARTPYYLLFWYVGASNYIASTYCGPQNFTAPVRLTAMPSSVNSFAAGGWSPATGTVVLSTSATIGPASLSATIFVDTMDTNTRYMPIVWFGLRNV